MRKVCQINRLASNWGQIFDNGQPPVGFRQGLDARRVRHQGKTTPTWYVPMRSFACLALGLAASLSGCATTELYTYRNPALANTHYDRLSVYVNSGDLGLRKRLETRVCQAMAPTPCVPVGEVVFPGSVHGFGPLLDALEAQGLSNVLVIEVGQDHASRTVAGSISSTQSSASGSAYTQGTGQTRYQGNGRWASDYQGTTTGYAHGSSTTVTAPIVFYNRHAKGEVELVDTHTSQTAWKGSLVTNGQGVFAITDSSFERAQALNLAKELHASGFFPPVPGR